MFYDLIPYNWKGLTKDYQECLGPWSNNNSDFCEVNVEEYYDDLITYIGRKYEKDYEEENEVLKTIVMLFEYAKENNFAIQIKIV
jgi:hypothetical protein